jgi:hypothetical protein
MIVFRYGNCSYLIVDCIKILLAKQLKSKMTLHILKIKKGISVVLMVLIGFDNTRMVSKKKRNG